MILVETRTFAREREALLNAEEFRALQHDLLMHPERGEVIRGSGGARKARLKMRGKGKRGGGRVIYVYYGRRRSPLSPGRLFEIGRGRPYP